MSAFEIAPLVAIAERASTRTTVVEVNAHDRSALLAGLAAAIHNQGHVIISAHIATYGERAVDVFYLTRADGRKLSGERLSCSAPRCSQRRANPPRPKRPERKGPAGARPFRSTSSGPSRSAALRCRRRWRWRWRRSRASFGCQNYRLLHQWLALPGEEAVAEAAAVGVAAEPDG